MIGARQTWGRRPAICETVFPLGEMPLQTARRLFRLGKCPCNLRDDFSAWGNRPANCETTFEPFDRPQFLRFKVKNHLKTLDF